MDILNIKPLSRLCKRLLCFLVIMSVSCTGFAENLQVTQKQKVVAGAVYKFIKFIEWKDDTSTPKDSFTMCLQEYDQAFEAFHNRTVQGKAIKLQILSNGDKVELCDALYLNDQQADYADLFERIRNRPILTIGYQLSFLEQGGVIMLGDQNNRLTFSINLHEAKTRQLSIGFQLLSLAKDVIES